MLLGGSVEEGKNGEDDEALRSYLQDIIAEVKAEARNGTEGDDQRQAVWHQCVLQRRRHDDR